jgi:hypothetical protein
MPGERTAEFEVRLSRALAPIDPPAELEARVEDTLGSLVDMAADELEAWELRAMRDPRNWLRPAAAVVVGSAAALGLVVVRTRRRRHRRRAVAVNALDLAGKTLKDAAKEARRVIEDTTPGR